MSRPGFVRAGRIPNWHLQADGSALSKMLLVLEKAGHFVQDVLLPPVLLYVSASHGKHAYVDGVNIARLRPGSHTPASWSSSITIRVSCSSEPRMSLCVTWSIRSVIISSGDSNMSSFVNGTAIAFGEESVRARSEHAISKSVEVHAHAHAHAC